MAQLGRWTDLRGTAVVDRDLRNTPKAVAVNVSRVDKFIALANALVLYQFVTESETYPVFQEWMKKNVPFAEVLELEILKAQQHVIADMAKDVRPRR